MRDLKRKRVSSYQFKYSELECPICMDEMKTDSRSVTAPCMHEFCLHCIGKWLMESSSRLCPLCKQMVKKIMYSIENKQTYSMVGFPADFCAGWTVRNKMKSVFDDFDNVLHKIYGSIKHLFEKERRCADKQLLAYLVWFANVQIRMKSRKTGDTVPLTILLDQETDLLLIKDLLFDRLDILFKRSVVNRILTELYQKHNDRITTIQDVLTHLQQYIDPETLNILTHELQCHVLLCRCNPSSVYAEYYIALGHNNNVAVLYTDDTLIDDKLAAALITKLLCSFHFCFDDDQMFVSHVSVINGFCANWELSASYQKLLVYISEAIYFSLQHNEFYKRSKLKNSKEIQSNIVSNKAYSLVKHCFNTEDFQQLIVSQKSFDKRYIFIEPVLIDDDSSTSSIDMSTTESGYVEITDIYMEISDSDEDALQVVSVQAPVFDLTTEPDEVGSPDDKRCRLSSPEIVDSIKPSTSKIECEVIEELWQETVTDISTPVSENVHRIDFVYQPRSVEDFYEYLLSENSPDNNKRDE